MINHTNSKAKDILFTLEFEEKLSEDKRLQAFRKLHRRRRGPPVSLWKYPIYRPLQVAIICSDLSKVCPRRWDELKIDVQNKDIRYCDILKVDIVKVTNMHNYNIVINKEDTISIPLNSPLHHTLSDKFNDYIYLYIFIQISRRIIQGTGYHEERDIHSSNLEDVLEWVFLKIAFFDEFEELEKFDIDFISIINIINKSDFSNKLKNMVSVYC